MRASLSIPHFTARFGKTRTGILLIPRQLRGALGKHAMQDEWASFVEPVVSAFARA